MKRKLLSILLAATMICTSLSSGFVAEAAPETEAIGTTYYVSTIDGNDKNSGTSEDQAFYSLEKINNITLQPGDQVLLENGSVFVNEALHIQGSGSEEAPILISNYGDTEKGLPRINTNGQGIWYQNYRTQLDNSSHVYQGYVSSAVLLYDVEYITVENLEITNNAPKIEAVYNASDVMNRTGVAAVAQNIGTVDGIHLNNLYIHDVIGNVYDKHMNNGGIYFTCFTPMDASTGIAKYDDVLIENCYVDNVNRWGIAVGYSYTHTKFTAAAISDEVIEKYGSTNVVIRNNYVKEAGGDAITLMYCDRPLVEYNVSDGAARQINDTDYANPAGRGGKVAAGIWPWKCKDAVFQYNEAFDTYLNQDGQAWDADSGDGTIYQYNYSHNNGGGSVMFCYPQSINNIFRYNISQNDLAGLNPCGNPDAHIYNNTFYMKEGVSFIRKNMSGGGMLIENNIIYYSGDSARTEDWYLQTTDSNVDYMNNLYYNYANVPEEDTAAVVVEKGSAVFQDPGTAPTAPAAVTAGAISSSVVHDKTAFAGYTPAENSPAVDAGKVIADNGGLDFFGNTLIGTPDIGAIEKDAVDLTLESKVYVVDHSKKTISEVAEGTTVEEFLANITQDADSAKVMNGAAQVTSGTVVPGMTLVVTVDGIEIAYVIMGDAETPEEKPDDALSNDNELKSAIYMVSGSAMYIPATEKNPTTVAELKRGITAADKATVKVTTAAGGTVVNGNVAEGMKLVIVAENGEENVFTISVKNTYHWAFDYAGPQQGNVWYGQIRNTLTEYENLTNYDPTWPNWAVDAYYGPGINGSLNDPITDETHGLLSDNPSHSNESMAMAFRAPKSGTITVSVKDDEPYLRQDGNSGGSVILSITKNGETMEGATCTLTTSKVKGDLAAQTVEVVKGDWIRIEAKNVDTPSKPSVYVTPIINYLDAALTGVEAAKSTLIAAVDQVAAYSKDAYTEESYAVLEEVYVKANRVWDKADATEDEVKAAIEELHKAIADLVEKPSVCTHKWGAWTVTKEATVLAEGMGSHTCSICNAAETRVIKKLDPTIETNAQKDKITLQKKQTSKGFKITGLAKGDSIVSITTSSKKVVNITKMNKAKGTCTLEAGKLTGKKGKATITITLASGLKKTIKVSVQTGKVKTTKITGLENYKKLSLTKGEKVTLKPVLAPFTSQDKVKFTTSNKKVVTVTSKGKITAKKKGKATIKVKAGSKTVRVKVTVK